VVAPLRVEQQSAFRLQHRHLGAKIIAGGISGEKGTNMVVGGKRVVAGLVGFIAALMAVVLFPAAAVADPTGAQAAITPVEGTGGTGSGQVLIAPSAKDHGTFAVEVTINIHGANEGVEYTVTRAVDRVPDGECTLDSGWLPTGSLATSAGGAGAEHVELHRGAPFVSGTRFDVIFRLVGDDGSELRSECVTVTVK
jgi:hypothetical protein